MKNIFPAPARYFEHKSNSYSNNKRKLFILNGDFLVSLVPYKRADFGGVSYGLTPSSEPKQLKENDISSLSDYYNELSQIEFFEKEITHIPT